MKYAYNLLLALASTSPMMFVYVINNNHKFALLQNFSIWITLFVVFVLIVAINAICIMLWHYLSRDSIEGKLTDVDLVNGFFLPNYLAYFFVAASITNITAFGIVYCITTFFVALSQTMYFNPFLLILGYNFYRATDEYGTRLFIITKREIREIKADAFYNLRRINDVTYIDTNKERD